MSYLLQYARRPEPVTSRTRGARLDLRVALNLPGYFGDAAVRAFVEDTTSRRWRRDPPAPRLKLHISDCVNEIHLEFGVDSAGMRANSLHKVGTLLNALARFRAGLLAEAELYEARTAAGRRGSVI